MSHDTHHDEHHAHGDTAAEKKSKTALRSAFWFVIILAGLYIAAINFVKVMSHGEGGEKQATEAGSGYGGDNAKKDNDQAPGSSAATPAVTPSDTTHGTSSVPADTAKTAH